MGESFNSHKIISSIEKTGGKRGSFNHIFKEKNCKERWETGKGGKWRKVKGERGIGKDRKGGKGVCLNFKIMHSKEKTDGKGESF